MVSTRIRQIPILAIFILLSSTAIALADFDYSDFSSITGLNLVSSATQQGNQLHLTPNVNVRGGAAWFTDKQAIEEGFQTVFEFQIVPDGADGFAFVVQNSDSSALGNFGAAIGYEGIPNCVAVEFDSYDPPNDHVAVNSRGTLPNSASHEYSWGPLAYVPTIPDFDNGGVYVAKIEYVPGKLVIFLNDLTVPILLADINLSTLLALDDGAAYVGFTAATGTISEEHRIISWSFREGPPTPNLDTDEDGDVDGVDFSFFAACFNKAGNPPKGGCSEDLIWKFDTDRDGDIDGIDFSVFASCFNKAGNPPRSPCEP